MQPGEISETYTLEKKDDYRSAKIDIQVKNMTDSPCSLYDATLYKMVISNSETVFIKDKLIELYYNENKEWLDPYKALNISKPKTEQERTEGVTFNNIKVLFLESQSKKSIKTVIVTFNQ